MIFALDTYLVLLSVVIGYQFFEDSYHFYDSGALLLTAVSMLISHHVCAFMFHQYKQVWTYTGIGELLALLKGITLSAAVTAAVQYGVFHTILFRLLAVSWMVQLSECVRYPTANAVVSSRLPPEVVVAIKLPRFLH